MSDIPVDLDARRRRKSTPPVGAFGPNASKKRVIDRVLSKVDAAAERRDPVAYYAGQTPSPERITAALDFCGLYGPEVDVDLGGEEPMVDEWEAGVRIPTVPEILALAKLTDFGAMWFYMATPLPPLDGWICGSAGCKRVGV